VERRFQWEGSYGKGGLITGWVQRHSTSVESIGDDVDHGDLLNVLRGEGSIAGIGRWPAAVLVIV